MRPREEGSAVTGPFEVKRDTTLASIRFETTSAVFSDNTGPVKMRWKRDIADESGHMQIGRAMRSRRALIRGRTTT